MGVGSEIIRFLGLRVGIAHLSIHRPLVGDDLPRELSLAVLHRPLSGLLTEPLTLESIGTRAVLES